MRILLVKTSSLGDVVHNLPAVGDILAHVPGAVIDWVVEESFAELPRLHPGVHRVIPVAMRRWRKSPFAAATWREIAEARRNLRAEQYDTILDSQGLLKSVLIVSQARGTPGARIGQDRHSAREPIAACFYGRRIAVPRELHAVIRNRLLAARAFGYEPEPRIDYGVVAPPLAAPWLPEAGYAVLLTATSRADKEWPEPDWQALGSALIATGLTCVLPGGSESERQRAARLANNLGRAVAAPPMNLTELAGLMAGAALVVGVDTGLVHLAAALGRPTLALYCASDPKLTGVLAGEHAINVGGVGTTPKAAEVVAKALKLLDR